MRPRFNIAIAATIASVMLIAGVAQAAEPLVIRVGWAETPGHLAPLIAELARRHPEVMRNDNKVYDFEPMRFPGSTPQNPGARDQATRGGSLFGLGLRACRYQCPSRRADRRRCHPDWPPGLLPGRVCRRQGRPDQSDRRVKGKRVATNAIGSEADSTMRAMLRKHDIKDSDFTTVEANFANQPAMLEEGKVDMIELLPQFSSELMATGKYQVLFTGTEVHGVSEAVFWCVRADFIATYRPALIDFFTDYMRAVRWFLDPGNRNEALAILVAVTHKPLKDVEFAFTPHDFYRAPDLMPDIAAVQREIDEDVALGVLPERITVSTKYVDLSLIKAAEERLHGHGA